MIIIAGYESAAGHVLEYDPRRDVDHVRDHAIARCGKSLDEDRLGDDWREICRACLRLMAIRQRELWR